MNETKWLTGADGDAMLDFADYDVYAPCPIDRVHQEGRTP